MKYKSYSNYKDSDVEWLGEIPEHWETTKLTYHTNCLDGKRIPLNSEQRGNIQGDIPYWGANGIVDYINDYIFDEELVLIGEDGAPFFEPFKNVAFLVNGKIWVNNHAHILKVSPDTCPKFIMYMLNQVDWYLYISGSTRDKLTQTDMNRILFKLPPLQEQQQIADFLDKATSKIDKTIEKQTKLIELLKEKRQAIISHAVTKGLESNVPMKDSGVEWLGEIPEHWEISKLKYDTYIKARVGWHGLTADELSEDGDAYAITGSDFLGNTVDWKNCRKCTLDRYKQDRFIQLKDDDLLVTKDGTIGKIIKVDKLPGLATLNGGIFVLRPLKNKYITPYYYWILVSNVFHGFISFYKTGSTISHLYQDTFNQMPYPLPSISEQKQIVAYIDEKTSKIDNLIEKANKGIALLKEKRTALISSAVIGKIDVRDLA